MSAIFPPYSAADPSVLQRADENGSRKVVRPNPVSLKGSDWTAVPVLKPSFLVPLSPPNGVLYARPFDRGDATSAATLQKTSYPGGPSLELSAPGVWYVYNTGSTVQATMLDATGAILEDVVKGYGAAAQTQVTLNGGVAATVLAANPFRRMAAIQNNGSVAVRLRWDGTDPTAAVGFRLIPNTTYIMCGDELSRNLIRGIEESGAPILDIVEGM